MKASLEDTCPYGGSGLGSWAGLWRREGAGLVEGGFGNPLGLCCEPAREKGEGHSAICSRGALNHGADPHLGGRRQMWEGGGGN